MTRKMTSFRCLFSIIWYHSIMQPTVLIIGSLKEASHIAVIAQKHNLACANADSIESAIESCTTQRVELLFAAPDIKLPALFSALNEAKLTIPTVATGPAQPVKNAVTAIRLGAIEYLSTPLQSDLLEPLIAPLSPKEQDAISPIHGDAKTEELLTQAKQFAQSTASVLLRGESGTGKEVYSQYIHQCSPRKDAPFIAVNCAAIPENLLESELFGHEKGAFSGATSKRIGKFEQANGGTLLLDEISEMDLQLQAKLLRAIQERVIDPVGSTKPTPVDIRLIATTNRKLEDYVAEGKFREDLYFRLNVVMLEIPPLRDRPADIMPLAQYFATKYGAQNGIDTPTFTKEASEKLTSCYWKGNVRELENTIHRSLLMLSNDSEIDTQHIVISPMSLSMMGVDKNNKQAEESIRPSATSAAAQQYAAASGGFQSGTLSSPVPHSNVGKTLEEMEKELILSTLDYCQGNRLAAADVLGISIKQLRVKLANFSAA